MKLKLSFVTNSSSTSFVGWGIELEIDELKKKYGEKIFASEHIIFGPDIVNKSREEFFDDDFFSNIQNITDKVGLSCSIYFEDDTVMLGISPFKMEEKQTLKEFKEGIVDMFKKIGIDDIEVNDLSVIEACWMDG